MENPEIKGVEYQQGTLQGYEAREYLLEKFNHTCQYCGAQNTPLEIDHIVSRAHHGSDKISNLTLACHKCNQAKGSMPVEEFLKDRPEVLRKIKVGTKRSLRDLAAVNSTRKCLIVELKKLGLSVHTGTGGQTKFNRTNLGLSKTHPNDALCVGSVTRIKGNTPYYLEAKCCGRGIYQRILPDRFGFARTHRPRTKTVHGFQTGDIVKAAVASGKNAGTHVGRVAVRSSGRFNISTKNGLIQSIGYKNCTMIQRVDGYEYLTLKDGQDGQAVSYGASLRPASRAVSRALL